MDKFKEPAVLFGIGCMAVGVVLMFTVPATYSTIPYLLVGGGFGFVAARLM